MVNKKQLIRRTSKRANKSQEQCSLIITAFLEEVSDSLVSGEDVMLRDLGKLALVTRKQRVGYDIKREQRIIIPSRKEVVFKAFKRIKDYYRSQS